jgi:hypothetical protein
MGSSYASLRLALVPWIAVPGRWAQAIATDRSGSGYWGGVDHDDRHDEDRERERDRGNVGDQVVAARPSPERGTADVTDETG